MSHVGHKGEIATALVIFGAAAAIGMLLTNLTGDQSSMSSTETTGGQPPGSGVEVCCPLKAEFSGTPPNFCWRDDRVSTGKPGQFDACRYSASCPEGEHLEPTYARCDAYWDLAAHASGTSVCPKATEGTSYICVPNAATTGGAGMTQP